MTGKQPGPSFHFEVQYDRKLIRTLSRVHYDVSMAGRKVLSVLVGVVCLLVGGRLIGQMAEPWNILFVLYGCFSIAFVNVPARWRSEKICDMIEKSGRGYPCTLFDFGASSFTANTRGSGGNGDTHPYSDCCRLIETSDGYFCFISREAAFPLPFSAIPEEARGAFRQFLEEKTGRAFAPVPSLLNFNKNDLLRLFRRA